MHPSDKKPVELLNELLMMHVARYNGYVQAAVQTDVSVLQVLFTRYSDSSSECSEELCHEIYKLGGRPAMFKLRGTYEATWEDISRMLCDDDHMGLLNACYCEEFFSYKKYEYVLRVNADVLSTALKTLFEKHRSALYDDCCKVSNLRTILMDAA